MTMMAYQEQTQHIERPIQAGFSPYDFNGGTVLAIAGEDFSVIASDTRLITGFSILSRDVSKTTQISPDTVVGSCGFHGDVLTLTKVIQTRLKMFNYQHNKEMDSPSVAAMLSTVLYYRRFFPYYVYNIVAGLDKEGKGCVFSFDPVGSYERETYRAGGSASSMLQPLLDNQIGLKNQEGATVMPISKDKAVALVKDVFTSAAERDIHTGDAVVIHVISKLGITKETFPLRRD